MHGKQIDMERFAVILFPLMLVFGIAQMALGFAGIEYHLGMIAAIAALAVAFLFRFMLPITIGTYFGAVDVMDWPILVGILCAVPGLVFLVPGLISTVFSSRTERY